jgi:hypothetical protein
MAVMNTRRTPRSASKATLTRQAKVTKAQLKTGAKGKATPALAAEPTKKQEEKAAKLEATAQKLAAKQRWEDWVQSHAFPESSKLLTYEPKREDCVTQTECIKLYGLKLAEMTSLNYCATGRMVYGHPTKLFLREQVEKLACRKRGMLAGETGIGDEVCVDEAPLVEKQGAVSGGGLEVGKAVSPTKSAGGSIVGDGPASRTRAQTKANQYELDGGL